MNTDPKPTEFIEFEQSLLSLVVAKMPHLIFVKDRDGRFFFANPAMASFYGCDSPADLIGKTDRTFFPNDPLVDLFLEHDREVIDSGIPKYISREEVHGYSLNQINLERQQELHWLSTIKLPVERDGKKLVVGISTFLDNLVEQEQVLAQMRVKQLWENVNRQVHHRLGNKISTLETVLARAASHDRTLASAGEQIIRQMKMLLKDIRLLRKAGDINRRSCKLNAVLTTALSPLVHTSPPSARIRINGHPLSSEELPEWLISGDFERLVDCFQELAANAILWCPRGECILDILVDYPAISGSFGYYGQPKRYVNVEFRDNGPGVANNMKDVIFHSNYSGHESGTGLGLAIVKEVLDAHGGMIAENGDFGRGAKFQVRLPI